MSRRWPPVIHVLLISTLATLASAAGPLTKASKIGFDEAGALVVDGAKLFPVTLTIVPPPDARTPWGKQAYGEFVDAGVTFIRTGGPAWNEQTLEKERQYHAAAAEHGLRCSPWLGWDLANFKEGEAKKEQRLRELVKAFRGSPAMGMWKGADEPDWGKKPPEDVARVARIIREVDPDHPIWLVQAPRGTVDSLKRYDAGWDVGGIDIYPVSYPPGVHSLGANKEISMVGDYARMMREVAGAKPFWMTLQIAFSGTTKPGATLRMPTFAEQRFMAYQSIVNGSRGLVYFGGALPPTLNERDRPHAYNWTYWERVMRPLLEEVGTNSRLQPALVAADSKLPVKVSGELAADRKTRNPDAGAIEFVVREVGGEIYLFACKREGPTIQVRFGGLPAGLTTGHVMFEEPRTVAVKDGSFTDWFGPFDVHVYRFAR